jgi:cell division protein FtsW
MSDGRDIPRRRNYDRGLMLSVLFLVGAGIVMVYSASFRYAEACRLPSGYFFFRQAGFAVVGLLALAVAARLDYHVWGWKKIVYAMLIAVGVLLLVVLFGRRINGAHRWLRLGPISLQPSEMAKFAVVAFLAYGLLAKKARMKSFAYGFLPHVLIAGLIAGLILIEPDFGTFFLLGLILFVMLLIGDASRLHLGALALAGAAGVPALILFSPYRAKRLFAFLHPFDDPLGINYQLRQSLIALGSGGIFGRGPGLGRQKMLFLPELHTDFILANLGEELGFVGVLAVLALFAYVLYRGSRIALRSTDPFGTYLAFGLTLLLGLQVVISAGVVMGLLPTKGLPLPFVSYGGSSLVVNMAMAGVLLSISARSTGGLPAEDDAENRLRHPGERDDLPPDPLPGEEEA